MGVLALLLLAGLCAGCSFAPLGWWPAAIIGPAILLGAYAHWPRLGFGGGYAYGLGFNALTIGWVHTLVPGDGWILSVLLVGFEALFFGLLGWTIRYALRWRGWPLIVPALWVSVEWLFGHVPFGGFGWSRMAYGMVDSPYAGLLPLIAVSGLSAVTILVAALLAYAATHRRRRPALIAVATVVALAVPGLGVDRWVPPPDGGTVQVAMVQGDATGDGLTGLGEARSVSRNHLSETVRLLAAADAGVEARPDFILWAENSTDMDPAHDAPTARLIQSAAAMAGVPILVGTISMGPGPQERQTTGLWWLPDQSVAARYDKRNLVPFGEFVPLRSLIEPLVPIVSEVGAQSIPGTRPGILDVPLDGQRRLRVGDIICFELAYDDTVHEAVAGSQVVVVQSSNAMFNRSQQPQQQFAITRVRAMEARRDIVVATTDSVSGWIDPRGKVLDRTRQNAPASRTYAVPLRTALTPAVRWSGWFDGAYAAVAALGLLLAARSGVRPSNSRNASGPTTR